MKMDIEGCIKVLEGELKWHIEDNEILIESEWKDGFIEGCRHCAELLRHIKKI